MATVTWNNDNSTGVWNDADNWDTDSVPTSGDDVVFDATSTDNCTCDVAIDVASLTVAAGYSGKLDFGDSSYAHSIGGDATFDGSGEVDLGDATITCSGDWDCEDQTTWTRGTSTVELDGDTKVCSSNYKAFKNLIISGSYSSNLDQINAYGDITISGSFSSNRLVRCYTGTVSITGSLTITGSDLIVSSNATLQNVSGTVSVDAVVLDNDTTLNATGTLDSNYEFLAESGNRTCTLGAGTRTFTGNVTIDDEGATYTIDNSANPILVFLGDLTLTSTGTLNWTSGSGAIDFDGSNDQTLTVAAGFTDELDWLRIRKDVSTAKVTLAGDVSTVKFRGFSGRFDLNGNTMTSAGDVQASPPFQFHNGVDYDQSDGVIDIDGGTLILKGTAGTNLYIDDLDFDVAAGVTDDISYCNVTGSTATTVDGDLQAHTSTDGGGNSGWNFVVATSELEDSFFVILLTG